MSQSEADLLSLSEDMRSLLESGEFSDVTVVVGVGASGVKEFPLHKVILGARSPVFNAMFTSDCKETQENRVIIDDVTVDVFEILLRYIYGGVTPKLGDFVNHAMELFVAADKYQLDYLKKQCSIFMASKLTTETVAEILLLADMHSDTGLKRQCFTFIGKHRKEVQTTPGWKRFKEAKQVDLMEELMNCLLECKREEEPPTKRRRESLMLSINSLEASLKDRNLYYQ